MATDRDILASTLAGNLGSTTASNVPDTVTKWLKRHEVVVPIPANAVVTNIAEVPVWRAVNTKYTNGFRVVSCALAVGTNYTAANTNTMTVTLKKRDGAGGAATTVATANTAATAGGGLGDLTEFVPYALTPTATATDCNVNTVLTFTMDRANVSTTGFTNGALFTIVLEEL